MAPDSVIQPPLGRTRRLAAVATLAAALALCTWRLVASAGALCAESGSMSAAQRLAVLRTGPDARRRAYLKDDFALYEALRDEVPRGARVVLFFEAPRATFPLLARARYLEHFLQHLLFPTRVESCVTAATFAEHYLDPPGTLYVADLTPASDWPARARMERVAERDGLIVWRLPGSGP